MIIAAEEIPNIVPFSCDGTEVERSVQDLLVKRATNRVTHGLPDPKDGCSHEIRNVPPPPRRDDSGFKTRRQNSEK